VLPILTFILLAIGLKVGTGSADILNRSVAIVFDCFLLRLVCFDCVDFLVEVFDETFHHITLQVDVFKKTKEKQGSEDLD
jgi:hypothetical protein